VALAALTRPAAGTVRISIVFTPPERRRQGYAAALIRAVSRALLPGAASGPAGSPGPDGPAGPVGHRGLDSPDLLGGPGARGRVREIVMITDGGRPAQWGSRLPYQLVSERAVLRFGPATGPLPRLRATGPAPRLPTGPLPRPPRLGRLPAGDQSAEPDPAPQLLERPLVERGHGCRSCGQLY
jgi:hypothetical protein